MIKYVIISSIENVLLYMFNHNKYKYIYVFQYVLNLDFFLYLEILQLEK